MHLHHAIRASFLACALLLAACSNPFISTSGQSDVPAVAPEVKATVEQFVAKMNAHDAAGLGELLAEDQDFHWLEDGRAAYETHTAAVAGLTNFFLGFPESRFDAYDVKVSMLSEESAVATFKYTQTVAANGQASIKFEGAMTLSMSQRDGDWKIVVGHRSTATISH